LFAGGIPQLSGDSSRVWPYEDSLEGNPDQYDNYYIFSLEDPGTTIQGLEKWISVNRNFNTTGIENEASANTRIVWERPQDTDSEVSIVETSCPRCGHQRSGDGRNVIEPLRTTGTQAFGTLIEHAFRLQNPRFGIRTNTENAELGDEKFDWFKSQQTSLSVRRPTNNPNQGRKALAFSDNRQNAARLAGDLKFLHYRDVFRQLLMLALENSQERPIRVSDLSKKVMDLCIERGIDPTFGEIDNFWLRLDTDPSDMSKKAEEYLDTYLRREIADRRVGVEALGLARWVIPQLLSDRVPPLAPFNGNQTVGLLNAVLRLLASENVILPRSLDPEDWPKELVESYYRKVIIIPPNQDSHSFLWRVPEGARRGNNRLTRYLITVLRTGGHSIEVLPTLMEQLWKEYFLNKIARNVAGNRAGYGIPITQFALDVMPDQVYICQACKYISADSVHNICLRCHQTCTVVSMTEVRQMENNYYRKLSDFSLDQGRPDPFPLRVLEHTAQISVDKAAQREQHFQDQFVSDKEDPVQHGVDILSVTTTMEMGIDIGDLTVVGLHNTPPTVANYQQRAGRAGRRSDGIAEVLTFARHRSHDQYYYDRIAEIVTGKVRIPSLHLANPVIARRHLNALVLQKFFEKINFGIGSTNLFEAFGSVDALLENGEQRIKELRVFVQDRQTREKLISAASRILAAGGFSNDIVGAWLDGLVDRVRETASESTSSPSLLQVLIEKGELPRYAFPVDVVAFWTMPPSRWNSGTEVQRDLAIALSEYAPGGEIIIDGMIYLSKGLFAPFDDNPSYDFSGWYFECQHCHHIRFVTRTVSPNRPDWVACEMCSTAIDNSSPYRIMPAIEPPGFRSEWKRSERRYRGGGQERAGYASPATLAPGEGAEMGRVGNDGRLHIHQRSGDLYVLNRGQDWQAPGFYICSSCGTHLDTVADAHTNPLSGKTCRPSRFVEKAVLLHHFKTDVALFGVNLPPNMNAYPAVASGRAVWLSLGTAIRQGAAAYLQIDPDELNMGIRPWREPTTARILAEVFLYDTLPNGAGYALEVSQNIDDILQTAIELVNSCQTPCESACYRCILEYGNQRIHALLDRHLAFDILNFVLNGVEPRLSLQRQQQSLSRLEVFTQGSDYKERSGLTNYRFTPFMSLPYY
jgi:hypothetical protein